MTTPQPAQESESPVVADRDESTSGHAVGDITRKALPHPTAGHIYSGIAAQFTRSSRDAPLNSWVMWRIVLFGLIGLVVALLMLRMSMWGHPRVFVELWSDGIVVSLKSPQDLIGWVRSGMYPGDPDRFISVDTVGSVYAALTDGRPIPGSTLGSTSGLVRAFQVSVGCQVRIGFAPGPSRNTSTRERQLEFRIQSMLTDSACVVTAELDPTASVRRNEDDGWGGIPVTSIMIGPDTVRATESAVLRFVPDSLPIRVGRFDIDGVGFRSTDREETASLIQGGVLRLPTFRSDGEDEVRVLGRELGRGHPIQRGDQVQLNELQHAEMLQLEIGELIHAQLTGFAAHPTIAGDDKEPRLLAQLNDQNRLLWVFAFMLGAMGLAASIIEAAR